MIDNSTKSSDKQMTYTHQTFIRFKFIEVHVTVYKTSLQLVVTSWFTTQGAAHVPAKSCFTNGRHKHCAILVLVTQTLCYTSVRPFVCWRVEGRRDAVGYSGVYPWTLKGLHCDDSQQESRWTTLMWLVKHGMFFSGSCGWLDAETQDSTKEMVPRVTLNKHRHT